jgi:(2Fe-2S) ferredoxin
MRVTNLVALYLVISVCSYSQPVVVVYNSGGLPIFYRNKQNSAKLRRIIKTLKLIWGKLMMLTKRGI